MLNQPKHQSAYADYLYRKVDELLKSGAGAFTLKQLSEYAHLPITPSMRRRVNHAVEAGTLECHPIISGRRGSCNLYTKPGFYTEGNLELPF